MLKVMKDVVIGLESTHATNIFYSEEKIRHF